MKKQLLILALCVFSLPQMAAAKPVLAIEDVASPGGLHAWLVEDHSIPVIALQFSFKGAGSINDPDGKQGLAQMLSNTMDEGAGDLTSEVFQKSLRDLSIDLSFDSSRDNFSGGLKTLTANKDRAFELARLALTAPRFDAEAVARMKAANQSRVLESITDPEWIAARIMNATAFQGHVYAHNSGGTLASLEAIMPADLHAFHDAHLGRNNLVVTAAGDVTKTELAAALDHIFKDLPDIKQPPAPDKAVLQSQGQVMIFKKDIPQSIIQIMQPGIDRKDPDYQTAQILNFILGSSGFGSRLTQVIREKRGLTYGIYSGLNDLDYFDGLTVSTSTDNKNTGEMLSLIRQEWDRMKNSDITDKELADAKSYLIGALPLSMTSTDDIAGLMLSLKIDGLPIDYLDRRQQAIQKATVQDVRRLAGTLLDSAAMTTIIVGQPGAIKGARIIDSIPDAE